MNEQIKNHIDKYPGEIVDTFNSLRNLIIESAPCEPNEMLWARLPSYYVGDSFVRLIPFKDHINVEARAVLGHKDDLTGYKITPRGMVQIFPKQDIPYEILRQIFSETFA